MPAKNRVKPYVSQGYYYIYNSGVDKRAIFLDDADYLTFVKILKTYLAPADELQKERPYRSKHRFEMNLHSEISLLAYCLMPNNFQLLVKQQFPMSITKFMRRVSTTYVTYFNSRHNRAGNLFQGVYRGLLLTIDEVLNTIHKIHQTPLNIHKIGLIATTSGSPAQYQYSSYQYYISKMNPVWLTLHGTDLVHDRSDL